MIKQEITAAVDIGGTNTVVGFLDNDGNYLFGNSFPTKAEEDARQFIVRLTEQIKKLFKEYESEFLLSGIGIAAPSANHFLGTIESPSNLKWGDVNFVDIMKEYINLPIALTNDANAAAMGEYEFGFAKGMKNFIVVTLGTGLGSGIVVDGHLLYGENGLAGELGHTMVAANGRQCNCGRFGCLETYASANGIKRTIFDLLSLYNEPSELRNISFNDLSSKMINDFALQGDSIAIKAFDFTGEVLGKALANLVACFTSEVIILFGGLADSEELLLAPTRKYFEKYLLKNHIGKVQILKSKLDNGMAALLGASCLIKKEISGQASIKINAEINNQKTLEF